MPSTQDDVAYLEDLETTTVEKKDCDGDKIETSIVVKTTEVKTIVSATNVAPLMRQRTLMEMMSKEAKSKDSEPSAKKQNPVILNGSSSAEISTSISAEKLEDPALTTSGLQPLNSIPFSLASFKQSLTEEQKRLLELECETMGKSWLKVLKDEIRKPYFLELKKFLWNEGIKGPLENCTKVYPAPQNIYSWSNTPLGRVRVVIIGQDPYHGPGQAHGLCFSVPRGVAVPPSLRNIYSEIKSEYPDFVPPKHGNLSAWANDGVLLLNAALTVRANAAGSHSNRGWEQFTDKVIEVVDKYGGANLPAAIGNTQAGTGRGIVFMAWGNWALKRVAKLQVDKKKHLILTSAHPSPLSARRGFFGNGHFKAANNWLAERYGEEGIVPWWKLNEE